MVWLEFVISAALITFAATQLAKFGDIIAIRTRLGGLFVGTLLIAGATSLPELLTIISAISQGLPDLAAGNLLGSNMFNMFLLAILDISHYKQRLLRKAAMKHALSGSLAVMLISLVVFFIIADIPAQAQLGPLTIGVDSMIIILAYFAAMRLIQGQAAARQGIVEEAPLPEGLPSLRRSVVGFGLAAVALVFLTPWMVSASARIAEITGLGATFIGSTLVAFVTSLPEMVTTIAAARIGADDLAIGNLFGSNLFNMFALGLTDLFYLGGRFIGVIDPAFLLVGMLGLIMTLLGLIGNLARVERRFLFVEIDALVLILIHIAGLWLLYSRGITP